MFKLGSFGTGLITGLAESADKALKEDIARIRTRIDTISDARIKRIEDEQNERLEEAKTVEQAIQRGASIYGDPNSQEALAFAAGILKEEGTIDAYNTVIGELEKRKQFEPNFKQTMKTFITRPENARDILTKEKIAQSFLGPAKYSTDMPEGVTIDAGLMGKMFGTEKIEQRLRTRVKDEAMARGLVVDEDTGINLPANYFDRDAYLLFNMTPEQRMNHYQKVVNSDTATDAEKTDAAAKVDKNRKIIEKEKFDSADAATQVSMLESDFQKLSPADQVGEKGEEILIKLSGYSSGRDIITSRLGDIDQKINVAQRAYQQEPSEANKRVLEELGVSKRKMASLTGSQSDKVAFEIDEAIRKGDSQALSSALAQARVIDAAKDATKNTAISELTSMSKAINSLAMDKLALDPVFGVGMFEQDAISGNIKFIGNEELKEKANARLAELINEVASDALSTASTQREKDIITQTANIIGAELNSVGTNAMSETEAAMGLGVIDEGKPEQKTPVENRQKVLARKSFPNNNMGVISFVNAITARRSNLTETDVRMLAEGVHDDAFVEKVVARFNKKAVSLTEQEKKNEEPKGPTRIGIATESGDIIEDDIRGGVIGSGPSPFVKRRSGN